MVLRSFAVAVSLCVAACGGSDNPLEVRGEVFCESYETQFTGQCRSNCDAEADDQSEASSKKCAAKCRKKLKDDDTFSSDCSDRAKQL